MLVACKQEVEVTPARFRRILYIYVCKFQEAKLQQSGAFLHTLSPGGCSCSRVSG